MEKKGMLPNFKGDGVAVWENLDKNGNKYLSVKILGGKSVNCFAVTKKEQDQVYSELEKKGINKEKLTELFNSLLK